MIKRLMVLAVLAGAVMAGGSARAQCSGSANPYSGGTWSPQVGIGYQVGTGAPNAQWVGYRFNDGYGYLDATGGTVKLRTFSGWGANLSNKYLYDASITAGTSPSACGQVWPLWTWPVGGDGGDVGPVDLPLFPNGDGCIMIVANGKPCSFNGNSSGTGLYAVAAQTWAIYHASGSGSTIDLGTTKGSAPVGTLGLGKIGAPYYFVCAGSVDTTKPPASACSSTSTGVAIITHN